MSKQPRDDSNYPIPVLGYRANGGQQLLMSTTPVISDAFGSATRVISLYSLVNCFFEVGNNLVQANSSSSHFLPAGVYLDISLGSDMNSALNAKHISAVTEDEGILYISERI